MNFSGPLLKQRITEKDYFDATPNTEIVREALDDNLGTLG
jgi:hypothetical protein